MSSVTTDSVAHSRVSTRGVHVLSHVCVKLDTADLHVMLLLTACSSVTVCRYTCCGYRCNYSYTCTVRPCDILTVKNALLKSLHCQYSGCVSVAAFFLVSSEHLAVILAGSNSCSKRRRAGKGNALSAVVRSTHFVFSLAGTTISIHRTTGCPTRYGTRHFFNNSNTNEDIATKFEQQYVLFFLTQ